MRRWRAFLSALLLGLLAGCVSDPRIGNAASWEERFKRLDMAYQPNMIQLQMAVIERPLGDHYLNRELWGVVDTQVVELERKALLERNGLRVGQVVGSLPGELQQLLKSERSCINPRLRLVAAESSAPILLGTLLPRCRYQTIIEGDTLDHELIQAQCQLSVVPSFAPNGGIRLRFTPKVEHGETQNHFRVAPDRSGMVLEVERGNKTHPELTWEITLPPNQYLLVGTTLEPPDSLGYRWFAQEDALSGPVQRLLVLRAARAGGAPSTDTAPGEPAASGSLPLALQAIAPEFRASAH